MQMLESFVDFVCRVFLTCLFVCSVCPIVHGNQHPKYGCCGLPRSIVGSFKRSGDMDLVSFAKLPGVSNVVTRMLSGHASSDTDIKVDSVLCSASEEKLKKLTFFGIAECLEESLFLLQDKLVHGGE